MAKIIKEWTDEIVASDGRTIRTVEQTYWCKPPSREIKAACHFCDAGVGNNVTWSRFTVDTPNRQVKEVYRQAGRFWQRTVCEYSYA